MADFYKLIVPCKASFHPSEEKMTRIDLPEDTIPVSYYAKQHSAPLASLRNAFRVRSTVMEAVKDGKKSLVAGPGPNSFLFWMSLLVPESVLFAYFIRGDTLATVRHISQGRLEYPVATGLTRLFRWRVNVLLRQGRAIVFLYGEQLRSQYVGDESSVHVIAPLIEENFVRRETRPAILNESLRVLYVGRFSKEKNLFALIEACEISVTSGRPFFLTIVGFGPLESDIRRHLKRLGLSQYINFLGYVPHGEALMAEYDKHDLLCLPSKTEGVSRTVIEAFARKMPVVATSVGSLRQLFLKEIVFIKGFQAHDIFESISWCSSHRQNLTERAEQGQRKIERFFISKNVEQVHKVICNFLKH